MPSFTAIREPAAYPSTDAKDVKSGANSEGDATDYDYSPEASAQTSFPVPGSPAELEKLKDLRELFAPDDD